MRLESDGGRGRSVAGRGVGGRGVLLELGRGGLVDEFWVKRGEAAGRRAFGERVAKTSGPVYTFGELAARVTSGCSRRGTAGREPSAARQSPDPVAAGTDRGSTEWIGDLDGLSRSGSAWR